MRSSLIFPLAIAMTGALSCKKLESMSETKHTWGETVRDIPNYRYTACREDDEPRFPKTQKFLTELAKHIMVSNKETFKRSGPLDPDRFCIKVRFSKVANAGTTITDRSIEVYTALVEKTENLHELAYLMSHELAHITMKHTEITHPDYIPTSKYMALKEEYDLAVNTVIPDDFNQSLMNWSSCLNKLDADARKAVYKDSAKFTYEIQCPLLNPPESCLSTKTPGSGTPQEKFVSVHPASCQQIARKYITDYTTFYVHKDKIKNLNRMELERQLREEMTKSGKLSAQDVVNWREVEADDVGAEFYYRAGFNKKDIFGFFAVRAQSDVYLSQDSITADDCLRYAKSTNINELNKILHSKVNPGNAVHPKMCWRLIHLAYEKQLHFRDINNVPNVQRNLLELNKLRSQSLKEIKDFKSRAY